MRDWSLRVRALVVLVMSALLLATPERSHAGVPCENYQFVCVDDWTECPDNQTSVTECRSYFPGCRITGAGCGVGGERCGSTPQLMCWLSGGA